MLKIYLSGNISRNPETYAWREVYSRELSTRMLDILGSEQAVEDKLSISNPCNTRFDRRLRDAAAAHDMTAYNAIREASGKMLPAKDFQMIRECNLMVVNLELADTLHPPIGTTHELCWAADVFKIPVIAIVGATPSVWSTHPFQARCLHYLCPDVRAAVATTVEFFV